MRFLPSAVTPVVSFVTKCYQQAYGTCVSIVYGYGMADASNLRLMKWKSMRSNAWLAIKAISGYIGDTSCHVLATYMLSGFS